MLTEKQIAARKGKLTASRIGVLMTGDAEKIMRLYFEMTGAATEEDLSTVWPVRLGGATEALNLEWFELKNQPIKLTGHGVVIQHPKIEWAAATLDAWCEELHCPVECKHTGGHEPLEVIIDRYQPQLQWQMECTGAKQCALSVIMGASEPIVEFIPRDPEYAREMVLRGEMFMRHVLNRTPPVAMEAVPPPTDWSKVYDFTHHAEWEQWAARWKQTHGAANAANNAKKILKSLVPPDALRCHGHGIQITRDRAGRLSLREQT